MGARVTIRKERASDREQVFEVHAAAFETPAEARLVDALRKVAKPLVSLVAVREKRVVGHVLFTPASVAGGLDRKRAMGLAPLAVLPEHQRQGIGLRLVRAGLEACRHLGRDVIFVLGHPEYYPRFGFEPGDSHGIRSPYEVPPEAWMVHRLPAYRPTARGLVRYAEPFDRVS
jgi:putative acetyltransferase